MYQAPVGGERMLVRRPVAYATLSEAGPRAWVTLTGCNFECRGCFAIARRTFGSSMTPQEVVDLIRDAGARYYGHHHLEEVVVTGGEPTLDPAFLLELVRGLRGISPEVVVQTNAHLLTPDLTDLLMEAGMSELVCDIKALDDGIHTWYTGRSNRALLENIRYAIGRVRTTVNTLLIPGVVDVGEIEAITRFLAACGGDLEFRINPFRADLSPERMSRQPNEDELERARDAAAAILPGSVMSRSCLRERTGNRTTHWITVFPDGRMERRGMENYRERNRALYQR